jgi:hypothetical protein
MRAGHARASDQQQPRAASRRPASRDSFHQSAAATHGIARAGGHRRPAVEGPTFSGGRRLVSASSASRFDCCCVLLSGCVASLLGSMRVPIYRNRWYSGKISDLLCNAVSALEAHDACQPLHCMQACSLLLVQHASTDRLVWCWVQIKNGILDSCSIDESQLRGPQHGKQISDMKDRATIVISVC